MIRAAMALGLGLAAAISLPAAEALAAGRAPAGPPAPVPPTPFACAGPEAAKGRRLAAENGLKVAADPRACFSHVSIYGGPRGQVIAVAPSPTCTGGKVLEVYEQSNGGAWYSFFERPVCGAGVSIGPKSPWGDWMLTIGGVRYVSRGQYYVPMN